jgi:hypothetical protein
VGEGVSKGLGRGLAFGTVRGRSCGRVSGSAFVVPPWGSMWVGEPFWWEACLACVFNRGFEHL